MALGNFACIFGVWANVLYSLSVGMPATTTTTTSTTQYIAVLCAPGSIIFPNVRVAGSSDIEVICRFSEQLIILQANNWQHVNIYLISSLNHQSPLNVCVFNYMPTDSWDYALTNPHTHPHHRDWAIRRATDRHGHTSTNGWWDAKQYTENIMRKCEL